MARLKNVEGKVSEIGGKKLTGVVKEFSPDAFGRFFDFRTPNQYFLGTFVREEKIKAKGRGDEDRVLVQFLTDQGETVKFEREKIQQLEPVFEQIKAGQRLFFYYKGAEHTKRKGDIFPGGDQKAYDRWAGPVKQGKSKAFKRFGRIALVNEKFSLDQVK